MTPDSAEYQQRIADALAAADEEALLSAVSDLLEVEPLAVLVVWSRFPSVEDTFFRRVLAFALAKSTHSPSRYLWGPLVDFVSASDTDEATLTNTLSALQLYDEHDDILAAVLGPYFWAFAVRCAKAGRLALGGLCELMVYLAERDVLTRLLTRAQVESLRELLTVAVDQKLAEADATMAVLQSADFPAALTDGTERLDAEKATIVGARAIDETVGEMLRAVLENARSQYALRVQAEEVGGVIEVVSLDGGDATQGRLVVETLERLVQHWNSTIRESIAALAPNAAHGMTTYVLAPAAGSFILRFLVQTSQRDVVSQSFDEIARVASNPEQLSSTTLLSAGARSELVQFLDVLAQKNLNATLGLIDPNLFERPRRRVLHERIAPVLKRLRESREKDRIRHEVAGTLEGANHRQGTFEIQTDTIGSVKGDVPTARRALLLRKVIGERYQFVLDETVTTSPSAEDKRQWILVSINGAAMEDVAEVEAPKSEPNELTTDDVPQQDRLDRIIAVVRLVAQGEELHPKHLGMPNTSSSRRHILYMRQAAKVLGLLTDDASLTPAGRTLAQLPESRVLDFLSVRFEVSVVGRLWRRWARVRDLYHLDPETAEDFLLDRGLSESMAERRGRTLRKWLLAFKSLQK